MEEGKDIIIGGFLAIIICLTIGLYLSLRHNSRQIIVNGLYQNEEKISLYLDEKGLFIYQDNDNKIIGNYLVNNDKITLNYLFDYQNKSLKEEQKVLIIKNDVLIDNQDKILLKKTNREDENNFIKENDLNKILTNYLS